MNVWRRSLLKSSRRGPLPFEIYRFAYISGCPLLRDHLQSNLKLLTSITLRIKARPEEENNSEQVEAPGLSSAQRKRDRKVSWVETTNGVGIAREQNDFNKQVLTNLKYRLDAGAFILGFHLNDDLAEQILNKPSWRRPLLLHLLDQFDDLNRKADELGGRLRRSNPNEMSDVVFEIEMIDINGEKRQMSVLFKNTKATQMEHDEPKEIWDVSYKGGWGVEDPSQDLLRSRVTIERELGEHDYPASEFSVETREDGEVDIVFNYEGSSENDE